MTWTRPPRPHTNTTLKVTRTCRFVKSPHRYVVAWVAWWRNGRASDLRSRGREFDPRPGAAAYNDSGQVVHIQLPRRRHCSLVYGVVKLGTFIFLPFTPLRELTCNMGSHGVTCHPADVTFSPLLQQSWYSI